MPIVVPGDRSHERLFANLQERGVPCIGEAEAAHRDIRPARIGLLNLMPNPAMEPTEVQWMRWMARGVLQVEPIPVKFDDDQRERNGGSRRDILSGYLPFSQVAESGLDALIVTGDNLEVKPKLGIATREPIGLEEIQYAAKLDTVIDWARQNVPFTIYSCLAGHYALNHLHGIPRQIDPSKPKIVGVYGHEIVAPQSPFVQDMDHRIVSPHSRWGNVTPEAIKSSGVLRLLAVSDQVGWLLAEDDNSAGGRDLYIQGHPEYYDTDLDAEYQRDNADGLAVPENYYKDDDPAQPVRLTWRTDARALHANWIRLIYEHFSNQPPEQQSN